MIVGAIDVALGSGATGVFTNSEQLWPLLQKVNGPQRKKACLRGFGNNTGADQPAHLHRLISVFVIHFLENIICKRASDEISIF